MRLEKEMMDLQAELSAQKEANVRSPSNTMKNLVEDQKKQLAKKDRHIKVVLLLLSWNIFIWSRWLLPRLDSESSLPIFSK